jgi:hypothetical protein
MKCGKAAASQSPQARLLDGIDDRTRIVKGTFQRSASVSGEPTLEIRADPLIGVKKELIELRQERRRNILMIAPNPDRLLFFREVP